jgi:hypothetical protein
MDDADDEGRPDELLVEGVVHYDEAGRSWVADIDWSAVRHASDDRKPGVNGVSPSSPAATGKDRRT